MPGVRLLSLIAVLGVVGCSTEPVEPIPILLAIEAGDGQEAEAGHWVHNDLVVRAQDEHGDPVQGVTVDWIPSQDHTIVAPINTRTDSSGLARATWRLSPVEGEQTLEARVHEASATFAALATPPPPTDWTTVLQVSLSAYVDAGQVWGTLTIRNDWAGTVRLGTPNGCFAFPQLEEPNGRIVTDFQCCSCWARGETISIPPGETLEYWRHYGFSSIPAGEYRYRLRLNVRDINGNHAVLPDATAMVEIPGDD